MSTEKKKEQQLLEDVTARPAVQSSYSTAGLNSRKEVENALTNAVYTPGQSVTDAAADLRNWQQNGRASMRAPIRAASKTSSASCWSGTASSTAMHRTRSTASMPGSTPRTPATPARTPPHRLRLSPAATAPAMRPVRPSRRTSSRWAR